MARQNLAMLAMNRGLCDPRGLARADIKRIALSAEVYNNFMPSVLGSMIMRPGLGYTGARRNNLASRSLPFVFSIDDKAEIELTDSAMRIWISDTLLTRPTVTSAVAGGDFPSAASLAANWTDNDEAGATSAWVSAGKVGFTGTGTLSAIRRQTVAVVEADIEHALRIVVERGPITLRVGSAALGDQYISETSLGEGTHSLAFTPSAGSIYIQFSSRLARVVYLTSCQIEAAGVVEVTTPWLEADLGNIRYDQSGDVVFVACPDHSQRRIERRGTGRSWSCVIYDYQDGPFRAENVGTITVTPSVLNGNGTLTASANLFKSTQVGALWSVTSTGQTVTKSMTALNDATDDINVTLTGTNRAVTIVLSGLSGTGNTVILQRSFDQATWVAVSGQSWTADVTVGYTDGLDNQTVYYRLLCSVYAAGTTVATLRIATGSIEGIGRITAHTSETVVDVEVLTAFGAVTASATWAEGQWSEYRGFPSAVTLAEGRLWWAGKDKVNGSISDAFDGFDQHFEGDAGPIARSIGSGPVNTINWLLALQRLILGAQGTEFTCKSNSLDEPLTNTNFNIKPASTQGSAAVQGLKIDANGISVQRGGTRVYELSISGDTYEYTASHLSAIVPKIGAPGIVRTAVQRQPDTRCTFVRSDGTAAILVFDKTENVICWVEMDSTGADGDIEDVVVLPGGLGDEEDQVILTVKRTVNGSTVRYREKFALEEECEGGTLNKQADSFIVFTNGSPSATVNVPHLIGEDVVVWADGKVMDDGDGNPVVFTVDGSGNISLTDDGASYEATTGVVGLAYTAQWQSGKLLELRAILGTPLTQHKIVKGLGLILSNTHARGLKYGKSFAAADLMDMPSMEDGAEVSVNRIWTAYDQPQFVFPGSWSTDSRVCLQGESPKPVTVLAQVVEVEMNE